MKKEEKNLRVGEHGTETNRETMLREKEKIYVYNFRCSNCGRTNQWKIPFGTKVEKFFRELQVSPCPHCGCSPLALPPPI